MTQPAGTSRSLTILFTCVGRRVELLQAFRASAKRLGVNLRIVATDRTPTAPALTCADEPILVPSIDDDGYIPALREAIERSGAKALIPTIDSDLLPLSKHREQFAALGCTALVADPSTIEICRDKIKTYELHRVWVDVPEYNQHALQMFRHLGFVLEGHLRKTHRKEDAWYDSFAMGLLVDEYSRRRARLTGTGL